MKYSDSHFKYNKVNQTKRYCRHLLIILTALCAGCGHSYYLATLFENDRHFSHLSSLEREMTFRTEMGLYYSYYKDIVEADSIPSALSSLLYNNLTEFPSTINTLERFTLYPELVVGLLFRWANDTGLVSKTCYLVDRSGDDLPPVESCDGLGDPANFYVATVFTWNGLLTIILFLYGFTLSGSFLGGILTLAAFIFNHGEATRVQWTPPLRESWAYPLFLAQMLILTSSLPLKSITWIHWLGITACSTAFLVSWQFGQFALTTQVASLAAVWLLGLIRPSHLLTILRALLVSLLLAFLLLFGNTMLIGSLYTAALLALYVTIVTDHFCSRWTLKWGPLFTTLLRIKFLALTTIALRWLLAHQILSLQDDTHIWNLLRAKFSSFRDFHTLLYICAAEFDFMPKETMLLLCKTLLLPLALVASIFVMYLALKHWWFRKEESQISSLAQMSYVVIQTLTFLILAFLVMRLKVFAVPQLCIVCSLAALPWRGSATLVVTLLAIMAVQGMTNIKEQLSILGEYSHPQQEELLLWLSEETAPEAVFAGAMPTMASVLLSTHHPVVNHPHYEHAILRERTKKVYSLFSRKSASEVHRTLKEMKVDFVILDKPICSTKRKPGCTMAEIWDVEDPSSRHRPHLCPALLSSNPPHPFLNVVFDNDMYRVIQL